MKDRIMAIAIFIFKWFSYFAFFGTVIFVGAMVILPSEPGMGGALSKWGIALMTLAFGILFSLFLYSFSEGLRILTGLDKRLPPASEGE